MGAVPGADYTKSNPVGYPQGKKRTLNLNKGDIVDVTPPPVRMQLTSKGNLAILDPRDFNRQIKELFLHGLQQEDVKKKDAKFVRHEDISSSEEEDNSSREEEDNSSREEEDDSSREENKSYDNSVKL